MESSQEKARFLTLRILLVGLSAVSLVLCALGATAHYLKWALGNPWQLVGWLLSMVAQGQFQICNQAENSVLFVLDPVLCSRAPLEFPNGALEWRRHFR
ncbi:MAG: hypothetical protein DME94_10765 [Verrucomicrobia bacterium]|nr:MAG: hypothetical protein DME94_10765 [Verrucomicrobiota bacterium]